jgi:hypothetical protein
VVNNVHASGFEMNDPKVNFSDHVRIIVRCSATRRSTFDALNDSVNFHLEERRVKRLPLGPCRSQMQKTHNYLQPFIQEILKIEDDFVKV